MRELSQRKIVGPQDAHLLQNDQENPAKPKNEKTMKHGPLLSERRVIGLILFAAFLSSMTLNARIGKEPEAPPESLSNVYKGIAERALLVQQWPDSTTAQKLFRRDERGVFQIPSFPVSEAPLAVVAILDESPSAQFI